MTLKYIYSDESQLDIFSHLKDEYPNIEYIGYNFNSFKERKEAYKVLSYFGAKLLPFCAFYKDKVVIKAFYSEAGECNLNKILKWISSSNY